MFETRRKYGMTQPRENKQLFEKKPHQIRAFFEKALQSHERRNGKNSYRASVLSGGSRLHGNYRRTKINGNRRHNEVRGLRTQLRSLEKKLQNRKGSSKRSSNGQKKGRNPADVTCYKCSQKGKLAKFVEFLK